MPPSSPPPAVAALAILLSVAFASSPGSTNSHLGGTGTATVAAVAGAGRRRTTRLPAELVPRQTLTSAETDAAEAARRRRRVKATHSLDSVETKLAPAAAAGDGRTDGDVTAAGARATASAGAADDANAEEEVVDIAEDKNKASSAEGKAASDEDGQEGGDDADADSDSDADGDEESGDDSHHERAHDKELPPSSPSGKKSERCLPLGECEQCPGRTKRSDAEEGCAETGRRQRFECIVSRGEEEIKRYKVYRSCKRTVADEEFLMMRMQVICVLMGTLSVLSVRRQKRASASLFEQRRRMGDSSRVIYRSIPQGGLAENGGIGGGGGDDVTDASETREVEMV